MIIESLILLPFVFAPFPDAPITDDDHREDFDVPFELQNVKSPSFFFLTLAFHFYSCGKREQRIENRKQKGEHEEKVLPALLLLLSGKKERRSF